MMIIGYNWPSLLALRVKLLTLPCLIIIILILRKVDSITTQLRSTSVNDAVSSQNIIPQIASSNISESKCLKLDYKCFNRVQLTVYANDELIQSHTTTPTITLTSISNDAVTTELTTTTTTTPTITTAPTTNITNPEKVNKIVINKTTKAQETTTIMTSKAQTTIQTANLRKGSHYQTLARSKSKNLVKLENAPTMGETRKVKEEQQNQQHHHNSVQTNSSSAQTPTLPFNSITSSAKSTLTGSTSTQVEAEAEVEAEAQTRGHRLVKRFLHTSAAATALQEQQPVETDKAATIKAVLGHRLTIPCSNLSLNEMASFTNGGKVITTSTPVKFGSQQQQQQQPTTLLSSSTTTSRRSNQRLRQSSFLAAKDNNSAAVRTIANGQGISLIVWHKDDKLNSPVFTADARGASSLREAKQQTNYDSLRGRARLEESTRLDSRGFGSTPALVIEEAVPEDAGIYTCTIEFYKAPTQTHQAHVELINPPKNMIIRDDSNMLLAPGLIGPYNEDATLTLTCEVSEPGDPAVTQVTWWQLQSVSALPFGVSSSSSSSTSMKNAASGNTNLAASASYNRNNQANRSHWLSRALSFGFVDDNNKVAEYLTTITLEQTGAGTGTGIGAASNSYRDFFVAFHNSHSIGGHMSENLLVLPFADGHSLKRWIKVQQTNSELPNQPVIATNTLLANSANIDIKQLPQSSLQLNLARSNLGDEYLCLANNNDISPPLNLSVKINMNLKPTEVRIVNKQNHVFKLNQKLVVECKVYGSKPSAKIRWFKGNKEVEPVSASRLSDELMVAQNYISEIDRDSSSSSLLNTTTTYDTASSNSTKVSYLTLIPKLSDNQQSLTCSAFNPSIPNNLPISDSITMNVQFAAQLTLKFGANIKPDSIHLGTDVFMDCNILSNPPIDDLVWLFNGQPLTTNVSAGIIISNQSLVLQHVRVEHCGQYQCLAQNAMGKSESNKLDLKPKFAPICDYSLTKTRYEVAVNQPVKIDCNVLAEPADDIHFVWQFNQTLSSLNPILESPSLQSSPNSASTAGLSLNSYRVDEVKQYETNFTKSYVIFTPKTKRHYAQFLCSASNSVGKQEKPCVISVFPSDLPEPVFGCFTDDVTKNSFSIHCQAPQASSSSSRQNYSLELFTTVDSNTNVTMSKKDSPSQENINNASDSIVHLKQREEDQNGSDEQQSDDFSERSKNGDQELEQQQQQQLQVKKISSETSTFHVSDLKPDTSYNVVIYVQNAKGRSAPFYHQTTTLPASTGDMNTSEGQIQFINSKRLPAEASLADRLISYLPKMSDYLSGDNTKPLIGIGLAILLCTISAILLTFFVMRSCRKSTDPSKNGRKKRRSNSSLHPESNSGVRKLDIYDIREARLERNVQLEPATTSARTKNGLVGSGSDTSRETNTESTLISSMKHSGEKIRKQSDANDNDETPIKKMSAEGDISARRIEKCFQQQAPIMISANQQQQQQAALQGLYTTVKRTSALGSPLEIDHSNTPQVSIKSSSDCTSNNEIIQQVDNSDKFYGDQLILKCPNDQLSEPVYVINRNGIAAQHYYPHQNYLNHNQQQQQQQHQQPLRLLDPTSFWPYSDPGEQNGGNASTGTQVSSVGTGDSFERTLSANNNNNLATPQTSGRCQLVRDHSGSASVTPVPFNFLPSSMSIPVSLSDCFQQLDQGTPQRRLSQEILNGNLCITNTNNGSFLTLTPDNHHTRCHQQQQAIRYDHNSQIAFDNKRQPITSILPPENFESHHSFYCDDFEKQKNYNESATINGPSQAYYCTQTLDDTFRQSRSRVGPSLTNSNQTTDHARRGSYNGKFNTLVTNVPTKHHVKFEAQHNQCHQDGPHTEFLMDNNDDINQQDP